MLFSCFEFCTAHYFIIHLQPVRGRAKKFSLMLLLNKHIVWLPPNKCEREIKRARNQEASVCLESFYSINIRRTCFWSKRSGSLRNKRIKVVNMFFRLTSKFTNRAPLLRRIDPGRFPSKTELFISISCALSRFNIKIYISVSIKNSLFEKLDFLLIQDINFWQKVQLRKQTKILLFSFSANLFLCC